MDVVSCLKIPRRGSYICVTDDLRYFITTRFIRSRRRPPPPPDRPCTLPDPAVIVTEPAAILEDVGAPCKIPVPCYIHDPVRGVLSATGDNVCNQYMERAVTTDVVVLSSWDALNMVLAGLRVTAPETYVTAAFIGETKAYAAPWAPTPADYLMATRLAELGVISREFIDTVVEKHGALDVSGVIATSRYGNISAIGLNMWFRGGRTGEILAAFWVEDGDRAARKYALKLWDLYNDFAAPVRRAWQKAMREEPLITLYRYDESVLWDDRLITDPLLTKLPTRSPGVAIEDVLVKEGIKMFEAKADPKAVAIGENILHKLMNSLL